MHDIKVINHLFSVLGNPPIDISQHFKFYYVPNWQTPSFSPLLLQPNKNITSADLNNIELFFKKNPITNSAIKKIPYFNFLKDEKLYEINSIKEICDKHGWQIDPDPIAINIIDHCMPIKIPPAFRIEIYNASQHGVTQEYSQIIKSNFNADDIYINHVDTLLRKTPANSYTILIKNSESFAVAGGTVSLSDQAAFLTWGSVNLAYRNQKLHQVLLSLCKAISLTHDIHLCGLTTRNPFIRGKVDKVIEMYICRKC